MYNCTWGNFHTISNLVNPSKHDLVQRVNLPFDPVCVRRSHIDTTLLQTTPWPLAATCWSARRPPMRATGHWSHLEESRGESGPWTLRALSFSWCRNTHTYHSSGLFYYTVCCGHIEVKEKREIAVCDWDMEYIFMLYMHQEWMFLQNHLRVCLHVFSHFFLKPAPYTLRRLWGKNFFSPCNISLKNMKKEQL